MVLHFSFKRLNKMFDFNKDMVIGKWSKMYVVGKQVTREQAKDIISRTGGWTRTEASTEPVGW
jgi:hypothetical protein